MARSTQSYLSKISVLFSSILLLPAVMARSWMEARRRLVEKTEQERDLCLDRQPAKEHEEYKEEQEEEEEGEREEAVEEDKEAEQEQEDEERGREEGNEPKAKQGGEQEDEDEEED